MDPDACLDQLIQAAIRGDAAMLMDRAKILAAWLRKGGFPPNMTDEKCGWFNHDWQHAHYFDDVSIRGMETYEVLKCSKCGKTKTQRVSP